MAAGLPVDKWFAFLLMVVNTTVFPPAVQGPRVDLSEKIFSSDKIPVVSFQSVSDRWADEMQAARVRARSV